jgi:diacylglycerol kinase family enzyme
VKRWLVLLNPSAGTLAKAGDVDAEIDRIRDAFAAAVPGAEVVTGKPGELIGRAKQAAGEGFDAVIAGGGDGTLNAIANVLADTDVAFGVLPLGTHNHFAKDLGVPLDRDEAIKALASAKVEELPVAEVNGTVFLNFSSLGLHVEIVADRDEQREAIGRKKWLAMLVAMYRKISDPPLLRVKIVTKEKTTTRVTPSVIICNNLHQMKVFGVHNASVPHRGTLNVYVAKEHRPMGLVRLLGRAALGRLEEADNFEALALEDFGVFTRSHVRTSVDGELLDKGPPFRYRIRPKPLKVLVPVK